MQGLLLLPALVALGARSYLKWRDIWDIAFLYDAGVRTTEKMVDWIQCKLDDYDLDCVCMTSYVAIANYAFNILQ